MDQIFSSKSPFNGLGCTVLCEQILLPPIEVACLHLLEYTRSSLFVHILQLYQPIVYDDREMCTLNLTLIEGLLGWELELTIPKWFCLLIKL